MELLRKEGNRLIKIFSWKDYDGRDMVLCGPVARCLSIIRDIPEEFGGNIIICDDDCAGRSLAQVLEELQADWTEKESIWLESLKQLRVRIIDCRELSAYSSCYVFLAGKTFVPRYIRYLGYGGIDDFYSATAIIKDGFFKQDYFMYLAPLYRKQRQGLYLGGAEVVVTTRCTLQCRDCANLMQYYNHHRSISPERILASVKRLINGVDGIAMLKIIGGEPLLEQQVIQEIINLPEITAGGKVVGIQIITNGTIAFKEELLMSMEDNPLVGVLLSNYGNLSFKQELIKKQLSEHHIPYSEIPEDDIWYDFGRPDTAYQAEAEADELFRRCRSRVNCCTLLDGKLYSCPRAAHGERIGLYPELQEEGIDLLAGPENEEGLREALRNFYFREKSAYACSFCRSYSGETIAQRAVQLPSKI